MKPTTGKERNDLHKQLQSALADAKDAIDRAKEAANALEMPFDFLGRTYQPVRVVTSGGHFDHESAPTTEGWDSSEEVPWDASGGGIGC